MTTQELTLQLQRQALLKARAQLEVQSLHIKHLEEKLNGKPSHIKISLLLGRPPFPNDIYALRQLIEALAFLKGAEIQKQTIPQNWLPELEILAKARAAGFSWNESLEKLNYDIPDLSWELIRLKSEMKEVYRELAAVVKAARPHMVDWILLDEWQRLVNA